MFRNKSVDVHAFSMVPRADIPRSTFRMETTHKTTFDAGYLIPVFVEEVLPGDSFTLQMSAFARLATPLFPLMDNMYLDSFFFFVPNRLTWVNWKKFMGERTPNPDSSTDYIVPRIVSPLGGYNIGSIYDYMGLGTKGQIGAGNTHEHIALPLRAYNLIWNEWFRDENLQNSVPFNNGDGPDTASDYAILRRGKRHDYFTSALPWPQKGASVSLPLGTSAPVVAGAGAAPQFKTATQAGPFNLETQASVKGVNLNVAPTSVQALQWANTGLYADLSVATAATINQLRQSFQIQKLLERDARGGTRYTELVRSHFGVVSPDARLQRPEYLGGGSSPISINPVAQTSGTPGSPNASPGATPQGNLAAIGTAVSTGHGFSQSFTEHGFILGLVSVRADLTYQQGIRRMWGRGTRYDYYWPAFAMLGEQAINNWEIFVDGSTADKDVFGYQERWADYRHHPSRISGLFRSTATGTIDPWHLAQRFTTRPTLNATFIQDTPPVNRIVAVGDAANGQQFIFDSFFSIKAARPMPMFSVPGLIDHF